MACKRKVTRTRILKVHLEQPKQAALLGFHVKYDGPDRPVCNSYLSGVLTIRPSTAWIESRSNLFKNSQQTPFHLHGKLWISHIFPS